MISAGHYLATEAGHAVLEAGGNAVDAGVAGIALGVVHSDQVQCSGVARFDDLYDAGRSELVDLALGQAQEARQDLVGVLAEKRRW